MWPRGLSPKQQAFCRRSISHFSRCERSAHSCVEKPSRGNVSAGGGVGVSASGDPSQKPLPSSNFHPFIHRFALWLQEKRIGPKHRRPVNRASGQGDILTVFADHRMLRFCRGGDEYHQARLVTSRPPLPSARRKPGSRAAPRLSPWIPPRT